MRAIGFWRKLSDQRGDTLVEVMVSISVLGLVVVGFMVIMNNANTSLRNAIERTEVRTSVNAQTEIIHYVRDAHLKSTQGGGNTNQIFAALWNDIQRYAFTSGTPEANVATEPCSFTEGNLAANRPGSFVVMRDAASGLVLKPVTSGTNGGGRAVPGNGLWVDAIHYAPAVGTNQVGYTDLYVKACWAAISGGVDQQTSTIVRLYD